MHIASHRWRNQTFKPTSLRLFSHPSLAPRDNCLSFPCFHSQHNLRRPCAPSRPATQAACSPQKPSASIAQSAGPFKGPTTVTECTLICDRPKDGKIHSPCRVTQTPRRFPCRQIRFETHASAKLGCRLPQFVTCPRRNGCANETPNHESRSVPPWIFVVRSTPKQKLSRHALRRPRDRAKLYV